MSAACVQAHVQAAETWAAEYEKHQEDGTVPDDITGLFLPCASVVCQGLGTVAVALVAHAGTSGQTCNLGALLTATCMRHAPAVLTCSPVALLTAGCIHRAIR